jgi:HK97 family phage prohead protease
MTIHTVPESEVSASAKFMVERVLDRGYDCPAEISWARLDASTLGLFDPDARGGPRIYLDYRLTAREALETVAHEIRHAQQFAENPTAWHRLSRRVIEDDACAFGRQVRSDPALRSWMASMASPTSLDVARATAPSCEEMRKQAAELIARHASILNTRSAAPRAERHFRGKAPRYECWRLKFEQGSPIDDNNVFRGIASMFGSMVDSAAGPTIVDKGAFTNTLKNDADRVKILYQHDPKEPIGKPISMQETDKGLEVVGKISPTRIGREVITLMHDGVLDELSIGFDPVEWTFDDSGVRHLTEVRLWEFSLVTFAADPLARISA